MALVFVAKKPSMKILQILQTLASDGRSRGDFDSRSLLFCYTLSLKVVIYVLLFGVFSSLRVGVTVRQVVYIETGFVFTNPFSIVPDNTLTYTPAHTQ